MTAQVAEQVQKFILDAFLFGDERRMPTDSESLMESGVLDSTGVLELIEFLEEEFSITVEQSETVPANLDSIAGVVSYVSTKRSSAGEGVA